MDGARRKIVKIEVIYIWTGLYVVSLLFAVSAVRPYAERNKEQWLIECNDHPYACMKTSLEHWNISSIIIEC